MLTQLMDESFSLLDGPESDEDGGRMPNVSLRRVSTV